jgi:methionyl-tRNA formyltransferase
VAAALRVGFAGTPPFAATALTAILDAGFQVTAVLTRPDRPQGRGLKLAPSAVKSLALERGLALLQPPTLKDEAVQAELARRAPDVLVVAAYGLILPQSVLDVPPHGCINIHASLLPRWRGAAPVQRALLEGDAQTGISIMQMDAGLDTGAVISAHAVAIAPHDNAATLTGRLAEVGARAIV